MKKTIIYVGLALVAFSNVSLAGNTGVVTKTELSGYGDNSPLSVAIMKGDVETVKKFVEYGADVNERSNGLTPLMVAARYNRVEIITFLLKNGAKTDVKDDKGYTALKYAQLSKANEAIELLKNAA